MNKLLKNTFLLGAGWFTAKYIRKELGLEDKLHKKSSFKNMISKEEVIAAQNKWGDAIVKIGKAYIDNEDYKRIAKELVDKLYAYDFAEVLFKPTKVIDNQFRDTKKQAISYFIKGSEPEDKGFALKPWSKVRFENDQISLNDNSALAMGNYFFTDATTGEELKVEYSLGYIKNRRGELKLNLHHSSLPYENYQ